MSSASALRQMHEKKIKAANEPPGKKEVVWTPNPNDTKGAHTSDGFQKQVKLKPSKDPPPPKKFSELP